MTRSSSGRKGPSSARTAPARTILDSDHCDEPISAGEIARIWPARGMAGVELLYGKYRRFSFARHFHTVPAIGIVETGVMRTCCQGRTYRAPAGSIVLFNPGDVHAPQSADGESWSFRMFYLDDALLRELSELSGQRTPLWFAKPFVHNPALYYALFRLHRMLEGDPDPMEIESRLALGLAEVARYSLWTNKPGPPDANRAKVERAREFINASCAGSVTLRAIAAVAGLSPWHLLRSFRAQVGITPHAYLTQARIDRGRMLLRSGLSIAETAAHAGFSDQSHFTRQFKKFTGATPGRYLSSHPG